MTPEPDGGPRRVSKCANGHLTFDLDDWPSERFFEFLEHLQRHFGFEPGLPRPGLDAIIARGQAHGVPLEAGYDNWSGCYVMALDEAGDAVVGRIAEWFNEFLSAGSAGSQPAGPRRADARPAPRKPSDPTPQRTGRRAAPVGTLPPRAGPVDLESGAVIFREQCRGLNSASCCVLDNPWSGYEETALERDIRELVKNAILPTLARGPASLTPGSLTALLEGVLDARVAVRTYRDRLLSESGDYGNEFSPLSGTVRDLLAAIARALLARPDRHALLAAVPAVILDERVCVFWTSESGDIDSSTLALRDHLDKGTETS